MSAFRPRLRGLVSKLALFYLLLSLPTLMLVESTILTYEFQRFLAGVKAGSLERTSSVGSVELAQRWARQPATAQRDSETLGLWLDHWILRLRQPKGGLTPDESYILLELKDAPLAAAILDASGNLLARTDDQTGWKLALPSAPELQAVLNAGGTAQRMPPLGEADFTIERALAPIRVDGRVAGVLFVELRAPRPWHHLVYDSSFESPTVFAFLVVFGLASSLFLAGWVTRRLSHIARAASAWSRGDFSMRIADHARDEIGGLSDQLDAMALDLRSLMRSRAQLATLAERQRLARDLHDTVKQKAFALNLQIATARRTLGDGPAGERLETAQRLTQQIQQELAQILDELRASDTDLPFAERVRMRANDWSHTSGASLEIDIEDVPTLAAEAEEALLRVIDEALSNVLRHSGAQHVVIKLRRAAERVHLVIADNGSGFDGEPGDGMGLRNMRQRIEALPGGRFTIDSAPGRGTRLEASFLSEEST